MDQETNTPTIKGFFVGSHIKAVKKQKGKQGLKELEKEYGKPLTFGRFSNIPVVDEVRLIDCALKIILGLSVPKEDWHRTAGNFHFQNFIRTFYGRAILSVFRKQLKPILMNSRGITRLVFKNMPFSSKNLGQNRIQVTIENNYYPLEHFTGFFEGWLSYANFVGIVRAEDLGSRAHAYTITWKDMDKEVQAGL
jgi:uncharacterized protein (TIGR02265 family)